MDWLVLVWVIVLIAVIVLFVQLMRSIPKSSPLEPQDTIAEEIRREKRDRHNAARDYAEIQRGYVVHMLGATPAAKCVEEALATAFREGAKWQARRD